MLLLCICVLWFSEMSTIENILMFLRICPFFMIVKVGGGGEGGGAEHYWTIEAMVPPVLSDWGQASREDDQPEADKGEATFQSPLLFDLASTAKSKMIISHRTTKQA